MDDASAPDGPVGGPFVSFSTIGVTGANPQAQAIGETQIAARGPFWQFEINQAAGVPPLFSGSGAITIIQPLWSQELEVQHGRDCTIKALYGYFLPVQTVSTLNAVNVGGIVKVRAALIELTVQPQYVQVGHPEAFPRVNLFGRETQKQRIWWQRDWVMHCNDQAPYKFWAATSITVNDASQNNGNEPLLGGLNGGPRIRLPRFRFKVARNRWPILAISFTGDTGQSVVTSQGIASLGGSSPLMALHANTYLRAFIVR